MKKDDFGDRMKSYEAQEKDKFVNFLPLYARLDGRAFSKFTKNLDRPFDTQFLDAMTKTTVELVKEFKADLGYVQSDEISLCWLTSNHLAEHMVFGGAKQKLCSVTASYAGAVFNRAIALTKMDGSSRIPHFDCRFLQVPNTTELWNMFLWRQQDCIRNSISMEAQNLFSSKQLHGVSTRQRMKMLWEIKHDELLSLDKASELVAADVVDPRFAHGTLVFKEDYEYEEAGTMRTRVVSRSAPDLQTWIELQDEDVFRGEDGPLGVLARRLRELNVENSGLHLKQNVV